MHIDSNVVQGNGSSSSTDGNSNGDRVVRGREETEDEAAKRRKFLSGIAEVGEGDAENFQCEQDRLGP